MESFDRTFQAYQQQIEAGLLDLLPAADEPPAIIHEAKQKKNINKRNKRNQKHKKKTKNRKDESKNKARKTPKIKKN